MGIGAISLAWSQLLVETAPSSAFCLIQSRAWELMVGSLAALHVFRAGPQPSSDALGLVGLSMIASAMALYGPDAPFPGIPALLPMAGTVLVLLYATGDSAAARLLSLRPLVGIGLVSCSTYLWHQPVFAFARHATDAVHLPLVAMLSLSAASVGLGYLSWRFVETPFRDRARVTRRAVWSMALAGCAGLVAFGAVGHLQRGFVTRYEMPPALTLAEFGMPRIRDGWCFYSVNSDRTLEIGAAGQTCDLGETEQPIRTALLIGDSFAAQYEPFWNAVGIATGTRVRAVTTNWCHPSLTDAFTGSVSDRAYRQCMANRALLAADLSQYDTIILGGHWANLVEANLLGEVMDLLEYLNARGVADVVVMASPKLHIRRTVEANIYGLRGAPADDPVAEALAVAANLELAAMAARLNRVSFLNRETLFGGSVTIDGLPYSFDGQHLSVYGSRMAARRYLAAEPT